MAVPNCWTHAKELCKYIHYSNCPNLLLQQSTSNSTHHSCANVNRAGLGKAKPMKAATPNTQTITPRGAMSKTSLANLRAKVKIILALPGDTAPLGAVQEVVLLCSTSKAWQRLTCSVRSLRHWMRCALKFNRCCKCLRTRERSAWLN